MRRLWIALGVLVVILAAGITEAVAVDKTFDKMEEKIRIMEQAIKAEDKKNAIDATDDLYDWWKKQREWMETITYAIDIRDLSVEISTIRGYLQEEEFGNAAGNCHSLFTICQNLRNLLDFNFKDVV